MKPVNENRFRLTCFGGLVVDSNLRIGGRNATAVEANQVPFLHVSTAVFGVVGQNLTIDHHFDGSRLRNLVQGEVGQNLHYAFADIGQTDAQVGRTDGFNDPVGGFNQGNIIETRRRKSVEGTACALKL